MRRGIAVLINRTVAGLGRLFAGPLSLWLIVLIGFGLRAYHLGAPALWDDEAFAVNVANDIRQIALAALRDTFPPLHYYLLNLAMEGMGRNEFAIRFASLAGSVLAIPLTYQVGRALAGRKAGSWAALAMALSPFMVYFAQEARAYSWLVLLSLCSVYAFVRVISALAATGRANLLSWAAFVVASVAMLYTHLLGAWTLAAEGLYFLWFWGHRRRGFRPWVLACLAIGLLFLPWVALMWGVGPGAQAGSNAGPRQWGGLQTDAPVASLLWIWQEGRSTIGAVSLPDTLRQALVSFTVGDFIPPAWGLGLALGLLVIAAVGLLTHLQGRPKPGNPSRRAFPQPVLFLVLCALAPVLLSYVVAFPTSRPHWAKYFIMALPAFPLAIGLGLAALQRWHVALALVGAAFVVVASSFTLYNYYWNPDYARSDIRPAVAYLQAFSAPDDALLANPARRSPPFWYYYHGNLPYYSPVDQPVDELALQRMAARHPGLWVVQNLPVGFDPQQDIERWLTFHAYRTMTDWVGQVIFRYYSMPTDGKSAAQGQFQPAVRFGDRVGLDGYRVGLQTGGRAQVAQLELDWQALADVDEDYMVAARAVDGEGRVWGQTASAPLGNFRPTSTWKEGERVADHLGLLLRPGTPPGEYLIQLWLYREADARPLPITHDGAPGPAEKLHLATVRVEAPRLPPDPAVLGLTATLNHRLDGLTLLGYQAGVARARPGDKVDVTLFWRVDAPGLPAYQSRIWLEDAQGKRWGESGGLSGGSYSPGQVVREPRSFALPTDLPDGQYAVRLAAIPGGSEANRTQETTTGLFSISIKGREKQFSAPRLGRAQTATLGQGVKLLGYDLPVTQVAPGGTLPLTLYWQAPATLGQAPSPVDRSYTVFNHLVGADGQIAGQWDGIPAGGTLPTSEWVKGEVIRDEYRIPVQANARPGSYRLEVGMYDAATGQRLPVAGADGQPAGDHVTLETSVEVR